LKSASTAAGLWEYYRKHTPDVLISIDSLGKTVSINNPAEIGISDSVYRSSIKDTSYIMWMGEPNVTLINDIRRCITNGDPVNRSRYTLVVDNNKFICNYTAIKVQEKFRYEPNVAAYVVIQVYKDVASASPEPEDSN
jgi:hypothetical protein